MDRKSTNLIGIIEYRLPGMSKGHRAIGRYLLEHYEHAAYMTAARIGEEAGVSESTVVRFAMELGFDGYPHFQHTLQEDLKGRLTAVQRLNASVTVAEGSDILHSVIQSDLEKLKTIHEQVDSAAFDRAVGMILDARRIYILGVRSSAPLAAFLGFYFNLIFENVRLVHTTSVSEMFEQILSAGPGDVVIAISFPRYSKRTVKAMDFARNSGASVVAITDKPDSSVARNADCCLLAPSAMASFVDSLVAPLSLINALIVAVGLKRKKHVSETFEKLERIWDDYQVYEKDDDSGAASDISAVPTVRFRMVDLQRRIAAEHDVVMDGRDIGTFVLPDARCKIFLSATLEERTKRRCQDLKERCAVDPDPETVRRDIEYRDYNDSHRALAPLAKAPDAYEIDTTGLAIEAVVEAVLQRALASR